jgi:mono/diheme cytochrome c family protein
LTRIWPLALVCLALVGCRQEMAEQPYYKPLQANSFFADGRASRPLETGVVARDMLQDDPYLYTAKKEPAKAAARAAAQFGAAVQPLPVQVMLAALDNPKDLYLDAFPFPVTLEVMERGRERFNIFCAVCHDQTGSGNGIVVQRGFTKPPSFHTDYSRGLAYQGAKVLLRDAPVGYFFEVITNGYGAMPDYATQVPPRDRWAIVAYVRALQWSWHAPAKDLTPADKARLESGGPRP